MQITINKFYAPLCSLQKNKKRDNLNSKSKENG